MSKTKPPKLVLAVCEDKKEAVELWLDQFNDWCVLQGWRDTTKPVTDTAHWKAEICATFRLALPFDVLRMVKSTIVPTMQSGDNKADGYIGFPYVWEQTSFITHTDQAIGTAPPSSPCD